MDDLTAAMRMMGDARGSRDEVKTPDKSIWLKQRCLVSQLDITPIIVRSDGCAAPLCGMRIPRTHYLHRAQCIGQRRLWPAIFSVIFALDVGLGLWALYDLLDLGWFGTESEDRRHRFPFDDD